MEAIILVGGLGTRLKSVISDLPKPMAPIGNKPFLEYILNFLMQQGVARVILATGYKHEKIEDYFGNSFGKLSLAYSVETEPLGTGGAIKQAFHQVCGERAIVLNGDTLFDINLRELLKTHVSTRADITLALKPMKEFDRYGSVVTDHDWVTEFKEKEYVDFGKVNGGIYAVEKVLFDKLHMPDKFSFENDVLIQNIDKLEIGSITLDEYFIDIGVPEDYLRAQKDLIQ
jgi:D-glycero-alpha-D-manno-heptose 1-phosphate guanylyltransferase